MQPLPREAARIIVLDTASSRVLLLQYARANGETFWATPGGGLEPGETFELAAMREAAEEIGVAPVALEPLWEGTSTFHAGGRLVHQVERFFLLRLDAKRATADVTAAHRMEGILHTRWWTLSELQLTKELVFPENLASRIATLTGKSGERAT